MRSKPTKSPAKSAKSPQKSSDSAPAVRFVPPMLLQLVRKLPEGDHWQYEVKWDGYRGIAVIQDGEARLWSRNERDLGKQFGVLVDALLSAAHCGFCQY